MDLHQLNKNNSYKIIAKGVVDPYDFSLISPAIMHIENGHISSLINKSDSTNDFGQPNHHFIDLSEYYISPAYCDCHCHLGLSGTDFKQHLEDWTDEVKLKEIYQANLDQHLQNGVLTVREGGDMTGQTLNLPNSLVDVMSPGQAISREGFYGSFLGKQSYSIKKLAEQIIELAQVGATHCKIVLSGIISFNTYGKVGKIQFSYEELKYLVDTARAVNLPVMVHVNSPEAIDMAIRTGVNTIEHGYFITKDQIRHLAENDIAWVPTVIPVACQGGSYPITKRIAEEHLQKIIYAIDNKVIVGIGSDAGAGGVKHGVGLHQEINLFEQAGLNRETVLKCATLNGARITQSISSYCKSFLAFTENPLLSSTNLKNFNSIIKVE